MFYQHGPFGEKLRSKRESKTDDNRWTAKLALQSMQFWLLFFARICAASGTTVIVTHQVAHVVDVGYSKLMAASIFGLAGITSSFGRVVFGFIADLLTKQAAYTLNILMTMVGVGALMILRDPSQTWLLYVYVIFFWHRLRLPRGHLLGAHRGHFLWQGIWIDSRLLDSRCRGWKGVR